MMNLIRQLVDSPLLIGVSVALFFCASISIFDLRIAQGKRAGMIPKDFPELPRWVGIFHLLYWILLITLLVLNWRVGIMVWVVLFILKLLPVLETIGNILMAPFKPKDPKLRRML
jgi:hypothetical protein